MPQAWRIASRQRSWFIAVGLVLCATNALASTVEPMSVEQLADHSGQVIVGTVTGVRAYWADNPRRIETEVTLTDVEYLKGRLPDSTARFTLTVPGGEVEGTRLTVCCAPDFQVGERWILFLLPAYRTHPVVGVYQGALLIQRDAGGVERVVHRRHGRAEAITGIDNHGFFEVQHGRPAPAHEHVRRTRNVRISPANRGKPQQAALTYDEFLATLRPVLAASRDHHLTEPAGKRVLVRYQPVPLRRSQYQQQLDHVGVTATSHDAEVRGVGAARPAAGAPREQHTTSEEASR